MSRSILKARPGMTLPEVITALVIMGIIGAAITGVFISQSQLHDSQEKHASARAVSRGAVNLLMSELRMLERTGSVVAASASAIEVQAPFAFGVVCASGAANMTITRMPGDTMLFNSATAGALASNSYTGYAALNRQSGAYTFVTATASPSAGTATVCTSTPTPRMRVFPAAEGGGVYQLTPGIVSLDPGRPVMLLHNLKYEFKASQAVPGRVGLFRYMGSDTVEVAAPFDTTARFRFYVNDGLTSGPTAPTPLSNITGLELVLDGVSERPNRDGTFPRMPYSTSVFFRNRL
jgi:prepilin-type N-terminal cleavage/methylation domain-containing protein